MSWALAIIVFWPALLGLLLARPAARPRVARLLPYASWPAVAVALFAPPAQAVYPALLLGLELGLDPIARIFLLFTGVIWSAVGFHLQSSGLEMAERLHSRFLFCFLLAMAGNLGVVLAQDGPGFYLFFAVLSLAAYGLIVADTEPASRRAGRLYLVLALLGEILMLAAFIFIAAGREGMLLGLLLYAGMGVKHGILPLHVWLPLAHGTAPAPASALLSGVLLKAGVIGWLRFLPETGPVLSEFSLPVIIAGLAAAFLGAIAGTLQLKPKMVLAYSSISQMGILTAGFGMALAQPLLWVSMAPVLALFALHHALVKAALFLGVAIRWDGLGGRLAGPLLVLLALALAGAPLTGGALVKLWLDEFVDVLPPVATDVVAALLPLTSVTTTVLMMRFLWLLRQAPPRAEPGIGRPPASPRPFLVLGVLALLGPWWLVVMIQPQVATLALSLYAIWKTLWPVVLGLLPVLVALRLGWRLRWSLPPGDVVVPLERLLQWLARVTPRLPLELTPTPRSWRGPWPAWEARLRSLSVTGLAFLVCLLVFALVGGVLVR